MEVVYIKWYTDPYKPVDCASLSGMGQYLVNQFGIQEDMICTMSYKNYYELSLSIGLSSQYGANSKGLDHLRMYLPNGKTDINYQYNMYDKEFRFETSDKAYVFGDEGALKRHQFNNDMKDVLV